MLRRRRFARGVFYGADLSPLAAFYPAGEHIFKHRGIFSVLAFAPAEVSISGKCKFPAENISLETLSGAGISNEASGEVKLSMSGPLAVFFTPHG